MPALKPQSPYVKKFNVSLPNELSRKIFAIEREQQGGAKRECPQFHQTTVNYLMKDLERIYLESNSIQDLQGISYEMVSHYFWPPSSLGIFYRNRRSEPLQAIEGLHIDGVRQITASDLAFGVKRSAAEHIIKDNKATYIPDTHLTDFTHMVQMPDNAMDLINGHQGFKGESKDILKIGWDFSSISRNLSAHSRCLFMMPFQVEKEKIGFFAVGFDGLMWGNLLPMQETMYQYLLGDSLKIALAKFVYPLKS
jgi:hypothetical protein